MKLVKWLDKHLEEILLVALLFVMMIIMGVSDMIISPQAASFVCP